MSAVYEMVQRKEQNSRKIGKSREVESREISEFLDDRTLGQVRKQIDLIEQIYRNKRLRKKLVLGGASALLYVHLEKAPRIISDIIGDFKSSYHVPRVTSDIDVDYRWSGNDKREEEQKSTVEALKELLCEFGKTDLRQNDYSANLAVVYQDKEKRQGNFKVEVNFMRPFPVLGDIEATFKDPISERTFPVLVLKREQSFANKWRTMISREKASDIFDVYHIQKEKFDWNLFMRCAVLECMLELSPRYTTLKNGSNIIKRILGIDIEQKIMSNTDLSFKPKVIKGAYNKDDLLAMRKPVAGFSKKIIKSMKSRDYEAIERFFTDRTTEMNQLIKDVIDTIDPNKIFDRHVYQHPQLIEQIFRMRNDSYNA
jgi:predicted nucleotidyltransferase component of viral defense system